MSTYPVSPCPGPTFKSNLSDADLDTIVLTVQDLGVRHAGYGDESPHYATAASALLWTLEQGLGSDFTEEVKDTWVKTYQLLAGVM